MIQSELPQIKSKDGKYKSPQINFKAEDSAQDEIAADTRDEELDESEEAEENEEGKEGQKEKTQEEKEAEEQEKKEEEQEEKQMKEEEQGSDEQMIDGKLVKLGKIESSEKQDDKDTDSGISDSAPKRSIAQKMRGGPGEGGIESYSGQGRETTSSSGPKKFVRWSSSTEIGDFIRDAARGKEFAVEIEGASKEIRVGVPSFNDRTHYLRVRLRKTSRKLGDLASLKKECDELAHRSAQRLAMGGFAVLIGWWGAIYHFTFQTDYGWDTSKFFFLPLNLLHPDNLDKYEY